MRLLAGPVLLGMSPLPAWRFVAFNAIGALLWAVLVGGIGWVLSMLSAGYWLGQIPWVQKNFEIMVLLIVFISILPLLHGMWGKWRAGRAAKSS